MTRGTDAPFAPTPRYVNQPDIDIAVHLLGAEGIAAPPVLLIHGGLHEPMAAQRFWFTPGIATALAAAGRRVLAPDRRYSTGDTRAAFAVHTWEAEVGDILAVLDALHIAQAHIVAGSNGCSVALLLAARAPQRCASLLLGWPAAPDAEPLQSAFQRTADAVSQLPSGADWLTALHRDGVPRPSEPRPGFAFGHSLLHDPRAAADLAALTGVEAAQIIRASARALLPGDPIRGSTPATCASVAAAGIPIAILPALPDDPWHPPRTVAALRTVFPAAVLLPEAAPPPAPTFGRYRDTSTSAILAHITSATGYLARP